MSRVIVTICALILTTASASAAESGIVAWLASTFSSDEANVYSRQHGRRVERQDHYNGGYMALASWYGGGPRRYEPNSHTANGERFNKWALTAAHRSLPFGTRLLVTHGGRSVVVRINDRGPAKWTGRSLDLSKGAAARLGMIGAGTAHVRYSVVDR
jgi:rare lipoprotein A